MSFDCPYNGIPASDFVPFPECTTLNACDTTDCCQHDCGMSGPKVCKNNTLHPNECFFDCSMNGSFHRCGNNQTDEDCLFDCCKASCTPTVGRHCASDFKVYNDNCETLCQDSQLTSVFECSNGNSELKCPAHCIGNWYCPLSGPAKPSV